VAYAPDISGPDAAESAPFAHLIPLVQLLEKEAREAMHARPCVARVRIDREGLTLLLKRERPATRPLPEHIIWLDGTANAALYKEIFGREVEVVAPRVRTTGTIYQVWASLNNKAHVIGKKAEASKRDDLQRQVQHIITSRGYRAPAVITYKDFTGHFAAHNTAHFYGLRGTNRLRECDALIVVGTPQANIPQIVDQAAMLDPKRLQPFDTAWSDRVIRYRGHEYGYAVSGFWHDERLQALLQQSREAELVQAAHRARPLIRNVDVWLLTNLPLADLAPDELLSLADLFDNAPAGIDPYRWPALRVWADAQEEIATGTLAEHFKISRPTAKVWFEGLLQRGWREIEPETTGRRGPQPRRCVKGFGRINCKVPL
jgi:hypothetical protein